jgi:hypothetical protein
MDDFYMGMLMDSFGMPDIYLEGVDRQQAGSMMLALTYFRHISDSGRMGLENQLYGAARGSGRGLYQYLITVKSWAERSPYERPWCLSPREFNKAIKQVGNGRYPSDGSETWWKRNAGWTLAAIGVAGIVTVLLPAEEAAVVATAAGNVSKGIAGVGGAVTLFEGFKALTGMATIERAYAFEASRRTYRPTI